MEKLDFKFKRIDAERDPKFDVRDYVHRSALETDIKHLITDDTVIYLDGVPVIAYFKFKNTDFQPLVSRLVELRYDHTERTGGLKTTSRVFGYQPRITLRRDFCSATSLTGREPEINEIITGHAQQIQQIYQRMFPERFEVHRAKVEDGYEMKTPIKPEWRIPGTVFTSGIINKNNPLKYHFDAGNLKGVNSCMMGFKKDIGGGYLAVPEIQTGFEIANESLLIFDGQSLLHGVTQMRTMSEQAHRFTMVFYSLLQMWKCEPLDVELARIRAIKTQRHRKRAHVNE